MTKWVVIGVASFIGVLDVLLILGCGKLERKREEEELRQSVKYKFSTEPCKPCVKIEENRSCDNCYYLRLDKELYPCSMCIRGAERTDKWRKEDGSYGERRE